MKTKRNLSGIYFRYKEEDSSWGNRCFEDLPKNDQIKYLEGKSEEWLKSMIVKLSDTLNEIGNQFDIIQR